MHLKMQYDSTVLPKRLSRASVFSTAESENFPDWTTCSLPSSYLGSLQFWDFAVFHASFLLNVLFCTILAVPLAHDCSAECLCLLAAHVPPHSHPPRLGSPCTSVLWLAVVFCTTQTAQQGCEGRGYASLPLELLVCLPFSNPSCTIQDELMND